MNRGESTALPECSWSSQSSGTSTCLWGVCWGKKKVLYTQWVNHSLRSPRADCQFYGRFQPFISYVCRNRPLIWREGTNFPTRQVNPPYPGRMYIHPARTVRVQSRPGNKMVTIMSYHYTLFQLSVGLMLPGKASKGLCWSNTMQNGML